MSIHAKPVGAAVLLGIIQRPSILSRLFLAGYGPTAVQLCVDTLLDSNTQKPLHQPVDSCGTGVDALPELGTVSLLVDWFRKRPT